MISKLLLATDGSEHAYRAAEKAVELASQLGTASVTVMHISGLTPPASLVFESVMERQKFLQAESRPALTATEQLLKTADIPYDLVVAIGNPAEEIVKKADSDGYDMVLIGSRGLSKLQELVIGSVSKEVIIRAKCPVLVIK